MNVRVRVDDGANDRLERNAMEYHCMSGRANWSKKLPRRSEAKFREETPKESRESNHPPTPDTLDRVCGTSGVFL